MTADVGRQRSRERLDVLTKPVDQMAAPDPTSREIEDQAFLVIDGGVDLAAVEDEERLHGGVPNTLVAIDKRVALDQRETQRRRFLNQRGLQIDAPEGRLGLGGRRLKCAKSRMPAAPVVASRRRRCSSTTSPSASYRIRRDAGTAPRSFAARVRRLP